MNAPTSTVTASDVEAYLIANPDFFAEHQHLLEHLTIPHSSGEAVSLVSKQLEIYRNRHHDMAQQLNNLIEIARENDAALQRMHELTLAMFDANGLAELVDNLEQVFYRCFQADFVALRIFHSDPGQLPEQVFVAPDDPALRLFLDSLPGSEPLCLKPSIQQAQFLFGGNAFEVRSLALVPLAFTELEGVLAVGSKEPERFRQDLGNLFLVQIARIVGTRLISLLKTKAA